MLYVDVPLCDPDPSHRVMLKSRVTAEVSNGVLGLRFCGTLCTMREEGEKGAMGREEEGRGRKGGKEMGQNERREEETEGGEHWASFRPCTLSDSLCSPASVRTGGSCVSASSGSSSLKFVSVLGS